MELIEIGKIVSSVGLKGQIKVYHYTDYKERFEELGEITVDGDVYKIDAVRYAKRQPVLSLHGIDSREKAAKLRGKSVCITQKQLRILPEDTYYVRDLKGCSVIDEKRGMLGTISDVIQNSSHDLYEVETESKNKILIPAVAEFVKKVDIAEKHIEVSLIEGFTDED